MSYSQHHGLSIHIATGSIICRSHRRSKEFTTIADPGLKMRTCTPSTWLFSIPLIALYVSSWMQACIQIMKMKGIILVTLYTLPCTSSETVGFW
jgi:hypothetical protein